MDGPNWLMIMNYALVLIVLVAWLGLFVSVGWELAERRARKAHELAGVVKEWPARLRDDSHRIAVPELGLTMADGGEKLEVSDDSGHEKAQRR